MDKSPEAFRTISEVADLLETPAHVLRFWESRFPQIRPVKRAGGRRYYRPADVALLSGIKRLLHDEGMTIRGVQKLLREQGVRHVSGMPDGADMGDDVQQALEQAFAAGFPDPEPTPVEQVETAQIVALETALRTGPVQPRRLVQENLFSGLFDDLPMAPPDDEDLIEDHPPEDEVPEAPMVVDAQDDDSDEAVERVVALSRMAESVDSLPESPRPALPASASLADRLAATPRSALAPHRPALRVLRDRLVALEDRMTARSH